ARTATASPARTRSRLGASGCAPRGSVAARRQRTSLALSEQAERPPHQQRHHDEVDEKGAELGKIIFAGHVADSEQARSHEGAADRAEPADRYHDQDVDQ